MCTVRLLQMNPHDDRLKRLRVKTLKQREADDNITVSSNSVYCMHQACVTRDAGAS
jgi:hypothetical protein